ncbi:Xaa-Pro aminopeptidase 1 [Hondaea fermentalgiana]|uniref:Xaa-Pro aminopeptidase 1 n=1 Tax=Hondaea fermentalgiana TaxID=2315210 RepID=A0A2R5G035_9STRA|nr:Xaa-Pro aminopeptidase 1 [Hondaea fermentalgiana]|eukprot:GBG23885.1 Xaa-Pro aminopeptidase 1 [Hondaea fermentalgiana]
MKSASERLQSLRKLMEKQRLSAYVVPSQDAHMSEYVADVDAKRAYLSSFTGSAGTAVVTKNEALLWTDGRYYEQAEQQLSASAGWKLMRDISAPSVPEYLRKVLDDGAQVGIHGDLISVATALRWDRALFPKAGDSGVADITNRDDAVDDIPEDASGVLLRPVVADLIDDVWGSDRPPRAFNKVDVHPKDFAGQSSTEKVADVRRTLKKEKAHAIVFTTLDDIAWLLNLRGSDIHCTPVFFAYVVVTQNKVMLFARESSFTDGAKSQLSQELGCDKIHPYEDLKTYLGELSRETGVDTAAEPASKRAKREAEDIETKESPFRILLDPQSCALAIQRCCIAAGHRVVPLANPVRRAKAIKNDTELEGMREAHFLEAIALCEFFAWLEGAVKGGAEQGLDEVRVSDKLEEFRSAHKDYRGPSFDTISAYGSNGAIVHYRAEQETAKVLGTDSLYLCDTGGQYVMGTTDMTRTFCFGQPSKVQRTAYTLVLEGHIRLAEAKFPNATEPAKLDILAREPLWKHGLNYKHGTGHGLGAFLGVHEFPPLIGSALPASSAGSGPSPTSLAAGMVLSNEPGFYLSGDFGIRIENVVIAKDVSAELPDVGIPRENDAWLGFETITFVPIAQNLIDLDLLSPGARAWVDNYHAACMDKIGPLLLERGSRETYEWLKRATAPLGSVAE